MSECFGHGDAVDLKTGSQSICFVAALQIKKCVQIRNSFRGKGPVGVNATLPLYSGEVILWEPMIHADSADQ